MNQADSLRFEQDLRSRGAVEGSSSEADLVLVNTCSVTATADQGARQTIRRVARDNPGARIVVTGCYASRCASDLAALPAVVAVVGNSRKDTIVDDLYAGDLLPTALRFGDGEGPCGGVEPGTAGRTAFTLRVQTGCEERCSYCIIPTTRGAGRSTPVVDVVRAVERAAAAGFKEIALTGVHLGSYGRDLEPCRSLLDLLRALDSCAADVVFRISSLEPMDCTPEIVHIVATSGSRFAPHFHLPLQHASDVVLTAMRRPYTLTAYRRLVETIAARVPSVSIGSDVIVGFPGETDADFERNMDYLPRSPLSHLHVFPYSDRPGTAAAAMKNKVDGVAVRDRGRALRAVGADLTRRFRASQVGVVRHGLTVEDGSLVVTDNYLKVRIPDGVARNERVRVRIDEAGEYLRGTVVRGDGYDMSAGRSRL
ncbi:MAG: threonylcarbamoyladenosine tRNA methylthiotransferase MtaB [Acidobacteriota bacterium]